MRAKVLARARALSVGVGLALAAVLSGCTAPSSSSVTVSGRTLTVYASAGRGGQPAEDVLDAERLALQQAAGKVGNYTVRLVVLRGEKVSDNARTAIKDPAAIAYLGEIAPGASAGSIGITNAQDLLQVSPTDTALELTQPSPAVANSPTLYYEALKTYGRTFARVVPNTSLEAKALVAAVQARGVATLYLADDGSDYSKALRLAVSKAAAGASITVTGSPAAAGAVLYTGISAASAAQLFDRTVSADPRAALFASSALYDPSFAASLAPAAARQTEISAPGFAPGDLPSAAVQQFVAPFRAAYGHAPAGPAIFGYEAMAAVLGVLRDAGAAANNRTTVVHGFFAIKDRPSVLGTYSIDPAGDTNLGSFVISRISGGRLVPFKSEPEQG
ncbi:MAG: hypothetical protein JO168_01020 [Solirubrobacterales bacterium]|nr:hypothetical protein [Solirubrobacterales bacterium]MBV9713813.1 hypothetical protein [Solirubrobacterales bacterium]